MPKKPYCVNVVGVVKWESEKDMKPGCTLTATLHARPEKRAELLELLSSFVDRSRSEAGCIDYHFHVSDDDPNLFFFY